MHYVTFGDWLLSLHIMPLRFIQVVLCINSLFLSTAEWYSIVWMYHVMFNYLLIVDTWMFLDLAFMNTSVINI